LKSKITARTGKRDAHYRRRVPLTALGLALAAAFVHALWNLLLARARDVEAATAVALVVGVAAFALPAAAFWHVDGKVWPYVAGSAALELVYFALLAAAYRRAEFSVVYPIARGSAPVLVLVVAGAVLDASTSWQQAAGIALVAGGVMLVRGFRHDVKRGGVAFGLTIGCCIAGYTLVDKYGIRYANPISYLELTMMPPAIVYAAAVGRGKRLAALRAETNVAAVVAGLATFGAYALVLAALERAAAASVAAVRETSVIIATVLAAIFLKERVGWARLAGAVAVAAGIGLLSLAS
jgi:drug/metabolite transporter (DMT)-like permease